MLVLEFGEGPEAEIHEVEHEELKEGQLGILAGVMEIIIFKFFARLVAICQFF